VGDCITRYDKEMFVVYQSILTISLLHTTENIRRLTGQAASIDDIKQLTYMAYQFSSKIVAVETVSKKIKYFFFCKGLTNVKKK
jgi:hypothetical protein